VFVNRGTGVPPANSYSAAGTAAQLLYIVGDPAIPDRPKIAPLCSVYLSCFVVNG